MDELQRLINEEIGRRTTRLAFRTPVELYAPVNYSLAMGGKRFRPVLLLTAYNLFREDVKKVLPAALALEVFHNFTLLHDDIMDHADVRRNKPTVHKKFSENHAILSGDAMAFLSFQYLMECESENLPGVLSLFTETALEVCEGQQYDMDFEKRTDVQEEEYLEMIRLKTAVLLGCSLKAGGLLAGIQDETAQQLYELGINLGLAFQLQDDWLDTFGDPEHFGKNIGGDILANKKTYLLIRAIQLAEGKTKTTLNHWLTATGFNPNEKIKGVTEIYNQLDIGYKTAEKVAHYFKKAEALFEHLPVDALRKEPLSGLISSMRIRST